MPIALSGRYAFLGRHCLAGLSSYVRYANARGGIFVQAAGRRMPLELHIYDDGSDGRAAARCTERLIREDRVDLLFGPYGSGSARAAAAVANAHGRVLWNHSGAGDTNASGGRSWVVSILSPASSYLCAVLDLIRSVDPNFRRVALCHSVGMFAVEVTEGVRAWAKRAGVALVSHQAGRSDDNVRRWLNELATDGVDVILGVGRFEDDLRLVRQLFEVRPAVKAIGVVAAGVSRFRDEVGPRLDGFLGPSQWEPQVRYRIDYGPGGSEFLDHCLATATLPLDYPAAQSYAAGLIAQRCVEMAGTLEQQALRAAAAGLHLTTFYGPYGIDPVTGRQTAHRVLVIQWRAGRKVVVWPPEVAEAEPLYPAAPWT